MNIATKRVTDSTTVGDWSDPRTALTIGASASLVVTLTSAISLAFDLPPLRVALALAMLFGYGQVFYASKIEGLGGRLFFTVVTGAVIFATAFGGNNTAAKVEAAARELPPIPPLSLISVAHAQQYPAVTNVPPPPPRPLIRPW